MSSSSSLGEADAKFGASASGLPPSPSRENPGQVFPKSDPKPSEEGTVPGSGARDVPTTAQALEHLDAVRAAQTTRSQPSDSTQAAGDSLTTQEGGLYSD